MIVTSMPRLTIWRIGVVDGQAVGDVAAGAVDVERDRPVVVVGQLAQPLDAAARGVLLDVADQVDVAQPIARSLRSCARTASTSSAISRSFSSPIARIIAFFGDGARAHRRQSTAAKSARRIAPGRPSARQQIEERIEAAIERATQLRNGAVDGVQRQAGVDPSASVSVASSRPVTEPSGMRRTP